MKRGVFALGVLLATIPAVGCGTISNQHALGSMLDYRLEARHQRLYGGVRSDGELICRIYSKLVRGEAEAADGVWGYLPYAPSPPDVLIVPYVTLFLLADMPLSLVADTILLPRDVRAQWKRWAAGMTESPPASRRPQQVEPPPREALKSLEENTFNTWQMTRHHEIPLHNPSSPSDRK